MDYDVLILGGGIIGCAVAYELSKYSLNIALIEKDYDIADDVALVNSAIVYDGSECEDTLVAKLELMGNKLIPDVVSKFNVRFKRCNSLIIAEDKKSEDQLINMYDKALNRGIDNIYLLNSKEVYKMEPNLSISVKKAIYSKNTGVIAPYDLAIAYGEVAFDNGVNFKLEEEVLDIQKMSRGFRVITNKNKFNCNMVLNTTPGENYSIDSFSKVSKDRSYLKNFLLERSFKGSFKNIVSTVSETNEKLYAVPTIQESSMIAIKTDDNIGYDESLRKISTFMGKINDEEINTFYESPFYNDTLITGTRSAPPASRSGASSATKWPASGMTDALHVVRDEPHRLRDVVTEACRSADREDGHGQPLGLALLVLGDGRVERPVEPEAAAQGVGVGERGAT